MSHRWITGKEVVEQLGIMPFELADLLQKGLPAYTNIGQLLKSEEDRPFVTEEEMKERIKKSLQKSKQHYTKEHVDFVGERMYLYYGALGCTHLCDAKQEITTIDSFVLPKDEEKRKSKIAYYLDLLFHQEEVDKLKCSVSESTQIDDTARECISHDSKQQGIFEHFDSVLSWGEIRIEIVNEDYIEIQAGEHRNNCTLEQLGFRDKRNNTHSIGSYRFLVALAVHQQVSKDEVINRKKEFGRKSVTDLRKRLKAMFPNAEGDPVLFDNGTYRPAFQASINATYRVELESLLPQ